MNNKDTNSYVIGFAPNNLLKIEQPYITDDIDSDWTMEIEKGIDCIAEATIFKGFDWTKEVVDKIIDEYYDLDVFEDCYPEDLYVYKIEITEEIDTVEV